MNNLYETKTNKGTTNWLKHHQGYAWEINPQMYKQESRK